MLYNDHFGFQEAPFSIAPDPRFLYMGKRHQEAFAHLIYGFQQQGGFVLLTGEVGTGKTTICRCLLDQLPEDTEVAYIVNPRLSAVELLAAMCDELRLSQPEPATVKTLIDTLNRRLLANHAAGRRTVLVIDEAQNLDADVLEQIRLLTNLETSSAKLLQVVLISQPELRRKLARPELRQLAQRITARYHLTPMARQELPAYVRHRLQVAGGDPAVFPRRCFPLLYRLSGGVPRLVNVICDRALLGAYVEHRRRVTRGILRRAAAEVLGRPAEREQRWSPVTAARAVTLCLFVLLALPTPLLHDDLPPDPPVTVGESTQQDAVAGERSRPVALEARAEGMRHQRAIVGEATAGSMETEAVSQGEETPTWRRLVPRGNRRRAAFADLFALWRISYSPEREGAPPPCTFARRQGLRCLFVVCRLEDLVRLNRPAVLQMFDEDGREFFVTLAGRQGERLLVQAGGEKWWLPPQRINLAWRGRATLLWRPPPAFTRPLSPGGQGPLAGWLAECLGGEGTATYGQEMVAQVRQLQVDNGLVPDGVLGERTLIVLQNCLAVAGPRLDPEFAGSCRALAKRDQQATCPTSSMH